MHLLTCIIEHIQMTRTILPAQQAKMQHTPKHTGFVLHNGKHKQKNIAAWPSPKG